MPLHNFICPNEHLMEVFQPLDRLREFETCSWAGCGLESQKRFLRFPYAYMRQDVHYESPVDGRVINSQQARLEDMARHNCVEYDPAMKDDQQRRQKESDERLERNIEQHFDAEVAQMTPRKRELLEQELRSGADLEITRSSA